MLRRTMLFGWLLSSTLIAPEGLAVPYLAAAQRSTAQAGYPLAILTASSVVIDLAVARVASAPVQRRIVASSAVLASLVLSDSRRCRPSGWSVR